MQRATILARFLENLTTKTRSSPSFVHLRAEPFPAGTSPNQTLTSNLTVTVILFSFRRPPSLQPGGCLVHCGHVGHGVSPRNLYQFQDERAQGLTWCNAAAGIFHDGRPVWILRCSYEKGVFLEDIMQQFGSTNPNNPTPPIDLQLMGTSFIYKGECRKPTEKSPHTKTILNMGFAAYYLSFLLIKPDHLKHHQCPPTQRYMNMLSDHPDASTKYTHKQTKWINMMCFKRGLMPNPYEISHPSTHKFHHLAATSTFRSVLSHLGIKAPDETRSIYRTMAAVDSGCEPLNVKVFQAWLLAVTHHVDVQGYWIEHTELEGLDPGELKRTDMCIYIYKHLAISKVLRQFIPTSHHVRDLYVSHHVTLIPLYDVISVQQVIAFVFESVLESLRLKSRFSTLQQLLASWSQTWKWAVSVDWYAMDFNAPNITTAAWDKKLPNSSPFIIRREMVRSFVMSVNPNMVRTTLQP